MPKTYLDSIPYGQTISHDEIMENLAFLDDWEERYRFIIDLGKQLPEMPAQYRSETSKVVGCQSQVWILSQTATKQCRYGLDSDALIVRGLICIVLSALNFKSAQDVVDFDMEDYFSKLDLSSHLSMQRGNGLRAMVSRVKMAAAQAIQT